MNTNNLFQDIQQKRANFKKYAEKALANQWISQQQFDDILHKIENDKLVVGVIGQMKAGKSTFLNALIFKDEILPAATTPMTASLSVITYGSEKKLEAEFYTTQEWAELKQFASLDPNDYEGDNNQQSKIKAAKEIVQKSVKIENELPVLLGSKKADAFENLIEYVGADGKYIAITKSVRIEYPLDYLKGVEIVDTPGFNDPVVSREERTKEFLSRADVVIMLLYAGRAFDATDNDIIFNKVRSIGVGKLLIGVNKYDINYLNGETNEMQIANVKEQLLKASEEHSNNSIASLIKEQDPLLISASMALMSQLDLSKINSSENLKFHYDKLISEFEISTQAEMYQKSLMPDFENAIRNIIFNSKEEILIKKPLNLIKQVGENKLESFKTESENCLNKIKILQMSDDEKEDELNNIKKAKKGIERRISTLQDDIEPCFKKHKDITKKIKKLCYESQGKCFKIIDNASNWVSDSKLQNNLEMQIKELDLSIEDELIKLNRDVNMKVSNEINDFMIDIEEVMERFLEDFKSDSFIKKIKNKLLNEEIVNITFSDLLPNENIQEGDNNILLSIFGGLLIGVSKILTFGAIDKITYRENVKELFDKIDYEPIKNRLSNSGNKIIEAANNLCINNFILPIEEQLNKALNDKADKVGEMTIINETINELKSQVSVLEAQVEEMKVLESTI